MSLRGWKALVETCSFRREGQYPIAAYSEFMPSVRLGCRPYGGKVDGFFCEEDPLGFPVTEFEEAFELRPGLENIAHQVLGALLHMVRGEPAERLAKNKLVNNPYWPPELARHGVRRVRGTGLTKLNYFGRVRIRNFITRHRRAYATAGKVRCSWNSSTCHR